MDLVPKEYKKPNDIVPPAPQGIKANFGSAKINFNAPTGKKRDYLKIGIMAAVALLILSIVAWGGLKIYARSLDKKIEVIKSQEAAVFDAKDKDVAEKIADLEKRAKIAQEFFRSHVYTSEILNKIALLTSPRVKWDNYELNVKLNSINLKGSAADYTVLAKQLYIFDQEKDTFQKVSVSGIALDRSGKINFSVSCVFNPKILYK